MKFLLSCLLVTLLAVAGCDKSEVNKVEQGPLPVTAAVITGDWMVTYMINNASQDMGLTFIKFNSAANLVATKDGSPYNGTWIETNTGGNNTLTLNVTSTDTKLQRINTTWKVLNISEYFIDLKDANATSNITVQLMKH